MRQTQIYCLSTKIKHSGKEIIKKNIENMVKREEGKILLYARKKSKNILSYTNVTQFTL